MFWNQSSVGQNLVEGSGAEGSGGPLARHLPIPTSRTASGTSYKPEVPHLYMGMTAVPAS